MRELTISTLVRYLKNKLDSDINLQKITVIGEISNYHRHYSGHLYFTLKDESAAINCVMFKSAAFSLSFEPKNGDKVVAVCNTSLFESSGQLQLYILKMNLYGLGDLYARYEKLKNDLANAGYFDESHKVELTKQYVDNVAVLVGDKSAAMSDIRKQFARRWPLANVDYYPVLVQGNDAPKTIIEKLIEVDPKGYDAIILARGGGSFEDLFCFNDENLVKTIYSLNTFIISGVGHEQDFTLTDFVSDLRAPTPTAAVEMITPDISDIIDSIEASSSYLDHLIKTRLSQKANELNILSGKLLNYNSRIKLTMNEINTLNIKMTKGIQSKITDSVYRIDAMNNASYANINRKISLYLHHAESLLESIKYRANLKLNNEQMTLRRLNTLLEAYASQNVLKRGFTLVLQDGKVVKRAAELKDKEFTVKFMDSDIKAIRKD